MLVGGRAEAAAAADTGGGGRRKHTQDQKSAYIPLVLKDAALGIIEQPQISFSYLHREIASPDVIHFHSPTLKGEDQGWPRRGAGHSMSILYARMSMPSSVLLSMHEKHVQNISHCATEPNRNLANQKPIRHEPRRMPRPR